MVRLHNCVRQQELLSGRSKTSGCSLEKDSWANSAPGGCAPCPTHVLSASDQRVQMKCGKDGVWARNSCLPQEGLPSKPGACRNGVTVLFEVLPFAQRNPNITAARFQSESWLWSLQGLFLISLVLRSARTGYDSRQHNQAMAASAQHLTCKCLRNSVGFGDGTWRFLCRPLFNFGFLC